MNFPVGKGYGNPSMPGAINCKFMNGIFNGSGPDIIKYAIDKSETRNIGEVNMIKVCQAGS